MYLKTSSTPTKKEKQFTQNYSNVKIQNSLSKLYFNSLFMIISLTNKKYINNKL